MKLKALAVLTAVFALTACGNNDTAKIQSKPSDAPKNQSVIRIATETSFKPFSYLDTSGKPIGYEIDLANALCQEMKANCEIVPQEWDSLIPSLQANKSDAIMAGMSATEERALVVDFSDPYFNNTLVLVGKKGTPATLGDLAGKNVGVQQATVSADYLAKNQPKAVIKSYDKQDNAYLDLSAGRIDFMLSDIVPISDWLKSDAGKDFEIKGEPIDINDHVAIAVRKGDALKDRFNSALSALKTNGKYDEITAKYFDPNGSANAPAQEAPKADTVATDNAEAKKPEASDTSKAQKPEAQNGEAKPETK